MGQLAIVQMSRREKLWRDAKGLCHWCKRATEFCSSIVPNQATVDHIVSRSRGGSDRLDNVVNACYECNQNRAKGDIVKYGHKSHAVPKNVTISKRTEQLQNQVHELFKQLKAERAYTLENQNARAQKWIDMPIREFIYRRICRKVARTFGIQLRWD